MKFSKRQDIEAPVSAVFAAISDFPAIERAATRRGIEVARTDDLPAPGPGMTWNVTAPIRGKLRDIRLTVTGYQPETELKIETVSGGIGGDVAIELVPLSRGRTRLQVGIDLRASTLPARIILQSLKLAKSSLDRRFARRIADFAAEIEARERKGGRTA